MVRSASRCECISVSDSRPRNTGSDPPPLLRWLAPDRAGRSSDGTPILFVRLARSRFQEGIVELMVHSSTPVWLRDAGAFEGRVTAEDAETNLRQLAGLLGVLASAGQMNHAELHVQGRLFENEAARLRATIGMQLGTSL